MSVYRKQAHSADVSLGGICMKLLRLSEFMLFVGHNHPAKSHNMLQYVSCLAEQS